MKNDLATAIIAAIAGVVISYFVCNMFVGTSDSFSFNTVDSSVSNDLASPDPELFNYRALNPTVEVYVGNCTETNMYGECVDASSEQIEEGIIEEVDSTEVTETTETTGNTETTRTTNNANQRSGNNGVAD